MFVINCCTTRLLVIYHTFYYDSFLSKLADIRVEELSLVRRILRNRGLLTTTSSVSFLYHIHAFTSSQRLYYL